ncbi:hypothetical protein [Lentzea sp. NPDC003310]|uniref:hypothetical protein n=1 Tax=Lentzea sp. NPDC003310 TaxID=3154447 RepID=UPI0033A5347A
MRKSIRAAMTGVVAAGALLVAVPGPALAAHDRYCTVPSKGCTAGDTPANSAHWVYFATGNISGKNYTITVRDVNNGKVVYSGYFNSALSKGLSNVYSSYSARIICDTGCPGATVHIWS